MTIDVNLKASSKENGAKVLVCDDSKIVRIAAKKILSERFNLVLAEDGEDAWEKISSDKDIQVVFTDLGMPRLDGFGLIQRVRTSESERIRNLPMIVITGATDDEEIKRKIYEVGATDFITKPFKATAITARCDAHTSYRQTNNALQEKVNRDVLTGALNRKGFDERLEKDMSFINRHGENLAISIFELDDFQNIYDRIGKKTAELVIKQVAKTLGAAVRKEDSIGRDGLAKFMLLLPMAKAEGVITLSKRLCEKIGTFKLKVGDEAITLSTSVGISTVNKGTPAEVSSLLGCAEQALANAKMLGRGEVQFLKLEQDEGDQQADTVSIDLLLEQIAQGQEELAIDKMAAVINRLSPLIALMSSEQRQNLVE